MDKYDFSEYENTNTAAAANVETSYVLPEVEDYYTKEQVEQLMREALYNQCKELKLYVYKNCTTPFQRKIDELEAKIEVLETELNEIYAPLKKEKQKAAAERLAARKYEEGDEDAEY